MKKIWILCVSIALSLLFGIQSTFAKAAPDALGDGNGSSWWPAYDIQTNTTNNKTNPPTNSSNGDFSLGQSQNGFYYQNDSSQWVTKESNKTDLAKIIKKDSIDGNTTLLYKIRGFFQLNGTDTYSGKTPATNYITMIINIALWLVSLVSLILVIFAFYLIFFDKWEEGVKKAKWVLKWVAIAITLIALSRIIVSFFFDFYKTQVVQ